MYSCTNKHGKWERVDRHPKTLMPLLYALADDLLHWQDGGYIEDISLHREDPNRKFLLRVILLYWCGDYPALGEVSGFKHGTPCHGMCHWCEISAPHSKETNSRHYGGFYRCVHATQYPSCLHLILTFLVCVNNNVTCNIIRYVTLTLSNVF